MVNRNEKEFKMTKNENIKNIFQFKIILTNTIIVGLYK